MALDYQVSMYSKFRTKHAEKPPPKRTSYEWMSQWQGVVTPQNDVSLVDDLMQRQYFPSHLNYTKSTGYDDNHKSFLRLQNDAGMRNGFDSYGPPRLRNGKNGGSWRHVKEVLQAGGTRRMFIDGQPGMADMTLVRSQEIPAGNIIHKVAGPVMNTRPRTTVMTTNKERGYHEIEEFKSTEHENWYIMR